MSAIATVWLRDFVGTKKAIARWSARCCWASLTMPALCNTLESVRASAPKSAQEFAEFLEPYRKDALEGHPWKAWAEHGNARR